jgi:hypothetical protein
MEMKAWPLDTRLCTTNGRRIAGDAGPATAVSDDDEEDVGDAIVDRALVRMSGAVRAFLVRSIDLVSGNDGGVSIRTHSVWR